MKPVSLSQLVRYCDTLLQTEAWEDYPGAVNGLQVENSGRVTKLAAAVDGSLATVRLAAAAGADLLLVHHGLFWSPSHPWTGKRAQLLRELVQQDLAVYSSHLPLDGHPRLGNNVLLAKALGFSRLRPFFAAKGRHLGWQARVEVERGDLVQRLEQAVQGRVTLLPGGPARCRRVGVVTGGAGAEVKLAAQEGVDTFITGEGPHWTFGLAEELGVNVLYGGHYATETFGVKALAGHLSRRFGLPWVFVDHPSGL